MNEFLQMVADFSAGSGIWVYLFILVGKLLEVTIGTFRLVLINRGMRTVGAIMAMLEIILWLVVASSVLTGFREDWLKALMYAVSFALGNYLGSLLDERLALGLCAMQVVIKDIGQSNIVCEKLRSCGFAVSTMEIRGRDASHMMLMMTLKRKRVDEAMELIEDITPDAVITINDIKKQRRGYLTNAARHAYRRIGK